MTIRRRQFLGMATAAAVAAAGHDRGFPLRAAGIEGVAAPQNVRRVAEMELDLHNIVKWDDSNGDTWDPFWADDDRLYSFNCDGRGFGKVQENLAFNRLDGDSLRALKGTQVNPMAEYGAANQRGKDNATWKACGQECIDGVFYAFVSRNVYGNESHDPLMRQTAFNSSLIKSTDRGASWTRTALQNYNKPMWPGPAFGAPLFVHYGKNGGQVEQDGALDFVYAVSTNGFWNDGDSLVLGRVARKSLPRLDPGDWEYFTGGDGMASSAWTRALKQAQPVLKAPAHLGQTPVCFVPALGVYLLISWYNPLKLAKWFQPSEMRYDFYQAEHPWGPWSLIRSLSDRFIASGSHMYGPALCTKFQEAHGDQVRLAMFTSGCQFEDKPSGIYKAWTIPVVLRTQPLPPVTTPAEAQFSLRGGWTRDAAGQLTCKAPGSSLTLAFEGTGVEYVARKAEGFGAVDFSVDGKPRSRVSLALHNFPALSGVTMFRVTGLPPARHILRLLHATAGEVNVEALRVFGAPNPAPPR